jgi:hypothetical protein
MLLRYEIGSGRDHLALELQSAIRLSLPRICQRCHGRIDFGKVVERAQDFGVRMSRIVECPTGKN